MRLTRERRNRAIKAVAVTVNTILDGMVCLLAGRAPAGGDVLIVRLDAIGDFLVWSDAAQRLAAHYRGQGRRVVLVCLTAVAPLAEALGAFDAIWPLHRLNFLLNPRYHFGMMWRLRRAGFAIAVQPTYSREFGIGDAVTRIAGRVERIGSAGDCSNQPRWLKHFSDRWYTQLIQADPAVTQEMQRNAEFLRGFGIAVAPQIGNLPLLPAAPVEPGNYAVLFPGASWAGRRWPSAHFAELAGRITRATGWRCILAGGKDDRAIADEIEAAAPGGIENRVGVTSLVELAQLLRGARLLVSNETSAIHMAALTGTPAICILGGGHFGRFVPYPQDVVADRPVPSAVYHPMDCFNCNWRCHHPRLDDEATLCIRSITVDAVWQEISRQIG